MSKLIDKLKLVSQVSPQPMGFGPGRSAAARPKILLIASVAQATAEKLADYVSGADAGLWHISPGSDSQALNQAAKSLPDVPWGWWLGGGSEGEIDQILKPGGDFVIFPTTTPLVTPPDDKTGRILQLDASASEAVLRTANSLPVNAVLLAGTQSGRLTWHDLMLYQRTANLIDKPLLAATPSNLSAGELQLLWAAGVDGVVVEVDTSQPAGKIAEISQTIAGLVLPRSRQRGKIAPLLPQFRGDTETVSEDEEEE